MVLYSEEQKFTQKWVINLLFLVLAGIGISIVHHLMSQNHSTSINVLVGAAVLVSAIGYFFVIARLLTQVTKEGVSFQFFPFHFKPRTITWDKIEKAYVRKYNPILEYGGWGLRIGLKGRAYNVSGNQGLQLVLKNGKKILVGTQRPKALQEVLDNWITME